MSNLLLNLNEVDENKSGGFEALPVGTYPAVVEEVELTESQKGAPMVKWIFKIDKADTPDGKGRKMFFYNVLNQEFGIAALKKTIINCGVEANFANFDVEQFCEEGDAIGFPINLKLGIQKYNGEKRNNVKDTAPSEEVAGF